MALYYVTASGVVPQSYLNQGYQALNYTGQTITVTDGSTYTLSPDLSGEIYFEPPSDGDANPNHPFKINIDESNANLTGVIATSSAFSGYLVPALIVADGVDVARATADFDNAGGSSIKLGSNVTFGNIEGSDVSDYSDVVKIGSNTTVGNIKLHAGDDTISMGDYNTLGNIDLGSAATEAAEVISGGTGNIVNGYIYQDPGTSKAYVSFSGKTTLKGYVDLSGGQDTLIVGESSSLVGSINMGSTTSTDDADVLNIGANSVVEDYIYTGNSNDLVTLGDAVTLKGGGRALDTYQGEDTLTVGEGIVAGNALDMGIGLPNDDLLVIDYGSDKEGFYKALADANFTDPDGDGRYYGGENETLAWNGVTYDDIDYVKGVCFAGGTLIETDRGVVAIENLSVGDLVLTRDNGLQPIRWIGASKMSAQILEEEPKLRPIRIRAGALGQNTPETDLMVSPQHRVLVRSKIAQRMFDAPEVLVAAKQLCQINGIDIADDVAEVTYFHMLFDRHEVVFSNGAETESLYTGPEALKGVGAAAAEEIFAIFPELREHDYTPVAARPLATGRMGRKLAVRHAQNNKQLVN